MGFDSISLQNCDIIDNIVSSNSVTMIENIDEIYSGTIDSVLPLVSTIEELPVLVLY